jgi:hypothetical protein
MRMLLPHVVASALVFATSLGVGQGAEVKIDQVSATPYTEFVSLHASHSQPSGTAVVYKPPQNSVLWLITFRMTPQWDAATQNFQFDAETFGVYAGKTRLPHLGTMATFGAIDPGLDMPYFSRPDDWQTEPPQSTWTRLWVIVPSNLKEADLRIDHVVLNDNYERQSVKPYTAPLKLSAAPKPFDVNDYVEVRVRAAKMLDSLTEKSEYDERAQPREVVNLGGSILQLTVQITPKQATSRDNRQFEWSTQWLGLSFGRGGRAVPLGSMEDGLLYNGFASPIEQAGGEVWDSKTLAVYFPVPSNLKTYDVTFLGHKVDASTVTGGR